SLPILVLSPACRTITSRCLYAAAILLPAGFFLGGLFIHDGDPGLGVLLVPPAALMLLLGVLLAARGTGGAGAPP
ncbi:MAG: hypothetical protein GTN84_14720, partial [Hydrogenophaga sp.]|uniref:hypothetical protein n=1 Tax=Hydrogenophaga sp. TaxID=1904254 RepID=UPI0016B45E52